MATDSLTLTLSGFARPADPVESEKLSAKVSTDIGKPVWVYVDATQAMVTGVITESDRAAIQTSINGYTYTTPQQFGLLDANGMIPLSFLGSGAPSAATVLRGDRTFGAPPLSVPVYALLANGATAMGFATNDAVKVTPTANATYTTTVPAAGSIRTLIILTSGATSRTITFGAGFKPTATLATGGTTARVFVISWISDGTNLYEVSRTVAMVA